MIVGDRVRVKKISTEGPLARSSFCMMDEVGKTGRVRIIDRDKTTNVTMDDRGGITLWFLTEDLVLVNNNGV